MKFIKHFSLPEYILSIVYFPYCAIAHCLLTVTLQILYAAMTEISAFFNVLQLPDLKDAEAVQKFFLEEIQLGEELLAQGNTHQSHTTHRLITLRCIGHVIC